MPRASPQLSLRFPGRGGRRAGAGRPRGEKASHHARPRFRGLPVHTTLRVRPEIASLRRKPLFEALAAAIDAGSTRPDFRVVHFVVLGNHLHLVVEASDQRALSRGMQGLCIRMARALNRALLRSGSVFADHYHSRLLRTPTEVDRAVRYVLDNYRHHFPDAGLPATFRDPCSSAVRFEIVAQPKTWLLAIGWSRAPGRVLRR